MAHGSETPPRAGYGGKEEVRAWLLKTYLLRLRAEDGEEDSEAWLVQARVDPKTVQNETGWLSLDATKRLLRALAERWGEAALADRGEWAVHPEALGAWVRMLREARSPFDAYRYLADHGAEESRVGTWGMEDPPRRSDARFRRTRLRYRPVDPPEDAVVEPDAEGEALLCAARLGELAGFPKMWGLAPAEIVHPECLAKGASACLYDVSWQERARTSYAALSSAAACLGCGGLVAAAGGWAAGSVAALLAAGLGGVVGVQLERSERDRRTRVFERLRISALERGLELKGELGMTPTELTGTVLGGKFRIGEKIGSGGIGVVYAAEHVGLGHPVAVKVLRGAAAQDGGEIARLRREAYIQVHLDHPNVARVLDIDQMPDGSVYVVMERLVGRSLADRLGRDGILAPGMALPIFVGVSRALGAAHAKGVVHRDLKPANIFLCEDGTAKVLDFGMSKLASADSLTEAGYTLGTPEYMAPEQCIGAPVEGRTDIYAFGVVMYEALTGELPVRAKTRRELLDLQQRKIPQSMLRRRPDLPIPEHLDAAVMRCLKKRVHDRPTDAAELEAMLTAIPSDGLPRQYPPELARRAPRRRSSAR